MGGGSHGSGMGRGGNKSSGNSTGKDFSPLKYEFKVKLAAD
jgi:hypothetical protein